MNIKKMMMTAALGLAAATASAQFSFDSIGQTYTEDFNEYRGSAETLPDHMFVSWDTSRSGMSGPDSPYTGVNSGAFTAYTSDNVDHSFGIRERNPVDLRDGRLFFEFTNDTGEAITGFNVSYDVEAWFVGDRRNRIRLKYDDHLDTSTSPGGRATFETDIFSTDNPSPIGTLSGTDLDGSLADNRTTVSGFVDLLTLDDGTENFFGPLAPGETAYFRWQFSNTDGDLGNLRSGLAINNVSITAIPEPSTVLLVALTGLVAFAGLRRRKA